MARLKGPSDLGRLLSAAGVFSKRSFESKDLRPVEGREKQQQEQQQQCYIHTSWVQQRVQQR